MSSHVPKQDHLFLLDNLIHNPTSLFEHKIFTALGLFMRNLSEQLHDYRGYYTNPLFNATTSLQFDVHETEHDDLLFENHHHEFPNNARVAFTIAQIVAAIISITFATWCVNKSLLRSNVIQFIVEIVVCYLIIIPVLPFIGLFYSLIGVIRFGIWAHIKAFHNGKRHLVKPEDAFWGYEKHASSSAMIGLYMIKGACDVGKITKRVKQVAHSPVTNGKMFWRMVHFCGFPVWEEVDKRKWSVNEHIKIAKWPRKDKRSKSTGAWSDKDVLDYLSTFQDKPMGGKRAPWEVIIVPDMRFGGNEHEPHYACIFRVHHAMMDGISSANILHQVLADEPFKFTMDPVEGKRHGRLMTFVTYLTAFLLLPRTGLVNGFLNLDNKHNKNFHPGKVLHGPKHFAWTRAVRMEALKKIKDNTKSSVMTVLLSGLGGSYRKMEDARIGTKKKYQDRYVADYYHALTPVAMLPYPDRHPRNGFSGVVLPVAVGEYTSAYNRLQANHRAFKNLNIGVMDVLGNFMLITMVGLMPSVLQMMFQRSVHFKMSMSNIPGSNEQIRIFGGDTIVDMGAWLPCKFTLGMAMGLFSYGGRCRATMVGDQTYLSKSDVESLTKNFETEIFNLGKSLGMTEDEIFY